MERRYHYFKAVLWYILSIIVSCINDAITKYMGEVVNIWQIAFFRFLFGLITLFPIMFFYKKTGWKMQYNNLHIIRGLLLFIAMSFWIRGMTSVPIVMATIMSFTIPLFVLVLARIWLKEKVTYKIWCATLLAFMGIILTLSPNQCSFSYASFYLIGSAWLFGMLDIINKKYVNQESILSILFYPTLIAGGLTAIPACYFWSPIAMHNFAWLGILGVGSNLILYFLLKAFQHTTISLLAPLKYLELFLSAAIGYLLFQEIPNFRSWIGALIIILCILFITYSQHTKDRN